MKIFFLDCRKEAGDFVIKIKKKKKKSLFDRKRAGALEKQLINLDRPYNVVFKIGIFANFGAKELRF